MGKARNLSVDDISRLLNLILEVADDGRCSPAEAIERVAQSLSRPTNVKPRKRSGLARFVSGFRRIRLRRNELLGAPLFRDPAWDMLLELYVAHEQGQDLSVSSLCYASGVPATTALRHIQRLEEHGLIEREGDRHDNRRLFVRPTEKAILGLEAAVAMLMDHVTTFDEPRDEAA